MAILQGNTWEITVPQEVVNASVLMSDMVDTYDDPIVPVIHETQEGTQKGIDLLKELLEFNTRLLQEKMSYSESVSMKRLCLRLEKESENEMYQWLFPANELTRPVRVYRTALRTLEEFCDLLNEFNDGSKYTPKTREQLDNLNEEIAVKYCELAEYNGVLNKDIFRCESRDLIGKVNSYEDGSSPAGFYKGKTLDTPTNLPVDSSLEKWRIHHGLRNPPGDNPYVYWIIYYVCRESSYRQRMLVSLVFTMVLMCTMYCSSCQVKQIKK